MHKYFFTSPALKQTQKLPKNIQKRIIKKLDYYCQKDPFIYAESLIDSRLGDYRFRIGNYRVIFDKESLNSILILKVGHRQNIYKKG
ncbi:type II toxin-antitoxin system RelE/ParE family toxin [Candidatus Shapirobacteria bacterium]|nr:type II toxin-antitoxin system RelE/ParE family toxin [Candidatus Shapirobacteria bacterium]